MVDIPIKWYAQFAGTAGAWTDITADVLRPTAPEYSYGIQGVGVNDRVASTGSMTLQLDNSEMNSVGLMGYYSPNSSNRRSGFDTGLPVKVTATYDGIEKRIFGGVIPPGAILPAPFTTGRRATDITVLDFMEQTAIHDIDLPAYATDKNFAELAALVFANMPSQPTATEYGTCESIFPYIFDTLNGGKTKAMTELQKGALSEFGYCYERKDGTMVIEGMNTRTDTSANSQINTPIAEAGYLLMHDGSYLLDNEGYPIPLSATQDVDISPYILPDPELSVGENLATIVTASGYPREIDATATTVLFNLPKAIQLAAGATLSNYRGRYTDPSGVYKSVNGINMGTAVYQAFQNEDGTGTNYSANVVVTPTYGTSEVEYSIVNNAGTAVWLTQLQAVGKGVYWDNPFSYQAYDTTAREIYGSYRTDIDMKYQDDPTVVQQIVDLMLARLKTPRTSFKSVKFIANRNSMTAGAFFDLDIGSRIPLSETVNNIADDYFIQGVGAVIKPGDIIEVTWIVKPALYDAYNPAVWDSSIWDGMDTWGA